VYAALRTDRAFFSFVVRGYIATPSMVCAGSIYSDAVNATPAMARRGREDKIMRKTEDCIGTAN
jgi:hypothetical protein